MYFQLSNERDVSDEVLQASAALVQLRDINQTNVVTQNGTDSSASQQIPATCSSGLYSSAEWQAALSLLLLSSDPVTAPGFLEPSELSTGAEAPQKLAGERRHQASRPAIEWQISQSAAVPRPSDLASRAPQSPPGSPLLTPEMLESSLAATPARLTPPFSEVPRANDSLFDARNEHQKLHNAAKRERAEQDKKAATIRHERSPPNMRRKQNGKTHLQTRVPVYRGSDQPDEYEAFLAGKRPPHNGGRFDSASCNGTAAAAAATLGAQRSPPANKKEVRFDTAVGITMPSREDGAARGTRSQRAALVQPLWTK
ncbi:MAG: hypothetical protein Q9160_006323 [Pyrenula sp. 1 TL-2023]